MIWASVFHWPILKLHQVCNHTDNSDYVRSHFSQIKPIIWIKMELIIYPGWTHSMFTCMLWFCVAHTHWGCWQCEIYRGSFSVDLQGQFQCEICRGSVRFTETDTVWRSYTNTVPLQMAWPIVVEFRRRMPESEAWSMSPMMPCSWWHKEALQQRNFPN